MHIHVGVLYIVSFYPKQCDCLFFHILQCLVPRVSYQYFCVVRFYHTSSFQIFMFNKVEQNASQAEVVHFDVTGTTYAPEGEV